MNILMMTNVYLPHIGGVARSVSSFARTLRTRGHRVVVVSPEFENQPAEEEDVIRIPAMQHISDSEFPMVFPIPGYVKRQLEDYRPDVIHSHHFFLLGATALRLAHAWQTPIVHTHHTRYELYARYAPFDEEKMARFLIELSVGFANLCDQVIAPTATVRDLLISQGVSTPISCIPTGIDIERFQNGNGPRLRQKYDIPSTMPLIGHVGRLVPEKNLDFLGRALHRLLHEQPEAGILWVGDGQSVAPLQEMTRKENLDKRVFFTGNLHGQDLIDAYHALDVFVFASRSDTQGIVLVEAMAAGRPVVALAAPGPRDLIQHGRHGLLIDQQDEHDFARAVRQVLTAPEKQRQKYHQAALERAESLSIKQCTRQLLDVYHAAIQDRKTLASETLSTWQQSLEKLRTEWELFANLAHSVHSSFLTSQPVEEP